MKFKSIKINQLESGTKINGIYILRKKELRDTNAGKKYIDLTFIDDTGKVNAKIWDNCEQIFNELECDVLYYINARVDTWKEMLQLSVNKIVKAEEEDQKAIGCFVPSAPIPVEDMYEYIYNTANSFKNENLKKLTITILNEYKDKLLYYPAAKSLHHSVRGGLLYHIKRMLDTADALVKVYLGVNEELLKTGVILHDMAKIKELEANKFGFAEYSKVGQLLGHIVIGVRDIEKIGKKESIDEETLLLVEHMITSHHYEPEYGSPKMPMFLEAELLHYIDLIDARVYDYENITEGLNNGEFSEPIWSLDKRRVYKYNI